MKINPPDPELWWLLNLPMYAGSQEYPGRTWAEAWANRSSYCEQFLRRDFLKKYGHEIDQPPPTNPAEQPDAQVMSDPDF